MRTKADFRACRELVGMSQNLLADLLGVSITSVKRWEHPDKEWEPPEDAWDILDDAMERQAEVVSAAVDKAHELVGAVGKEPRSFQLTYWHGADDYESAHPGEGKFWQMANANSRAMAAILIAEGYEVGFNFGGLANLDK